jgi:hypothetical protein
VLKNINQSGDIDDVSGGEGKINEQETTKPLIYS